MDIPMTMTAFERAVAVALLAEGVALIFLCIAAIAVWVFHRFPARTPYPEATLAAPAGAIARVLHRRRSVVGMLLATGLVLLLAAVAFGIALTWTLPFTPLWWVKWLVILVAVFTLWGFGWLCLIALRRFLAARREWHAKLAVAGVLKGFALAGHQVYHDVPVADLTVDHVVVGPRGVFLVNVAVRARPRNAAGVVAKLLPVERQLDLGVAREFEAVFAATRRVTEMGRALEKLLGHKSRPISAIVLPGWETAPTEEGDHLLFNLANLAALLSWAKPQHGLLAEDLPAINRQLITVQRVERPV
jgi:hypothetical protein